MLRTLPFAVRSLRTVHARALHERGLLYALPSCASSLAAPPAASPTQRVRYLRTSAVCSSVASALDVAHTATPSGGTYAVHLPDASKATLQYKLLKEGAVTVMDITHTYTPPAGRGQGLAGKLTDAAVANAASMGWQVQASCSYVRDNYFPANKGAAAAFEFDPDTARACLRAK